MSRVTDAAHELSSVLPGTVIREYPEVAAALRRYNDAKNEADGLPAQACDGWMNYETHVIASVIEDDPSYQTFIHSLLNNSGSVGAAAKDLASYIDDESDHELVGPAMLHRLVDAALLQVSFAEIVRHYKPLSWGEFDIAPEE